MTTTMIRKIIHKVFNETLTSSGLRVIPEFTDDLVLLKSGLDSLGFAILVARLEEELGFDPFSTSAEAYYPTTFGEFVAFYERNAPRNH